MPYRQITASQMRNDVTYYGTADCPEEVNGKMFIIVAQRVIDLPGDDEDGLIEAVVYLGQGKYDAATFAPGDAVEAWTRQ